jgi:hypothetical protein
MPYQPGPPISQASGTGRLLEPRSLVHTVRIPVGRLRSPDIELGDLGALPDAMFTAGSMGVTACDQGRSGRRTGDGDSELTSTEGWGGDREVG